MTQLLIALGCLLFGCVSRLIPHLANFSPMFCLALFSGRFLNKWFAYAVLMATMLISDGLLSWHSNYAAYGSWTWFTYSGFLAIVYLGTRVHSLEERFSLSVLMLLAANLGFWLWTNFGVWLMGSDYSHHLAGLVTCYVAAIPFLQYSLLGSYVWLLILFALKHFFSTPFKTSLKQLRSSF